MAKKFCYTDGEAVIMLAFQASGRGSTPLQCMLRKFAIFLFWTLACSISSSISTKTIEKLVAADLACDSLVDKKIVPRFECKT